jgi:DNA invertase Pin-like site-specific DNA recombinase
MADRAGRWLRVSKNEGQDERNQEHDIDKWIADHEYEPAADYRLRKSAYKGMHVQMLDQVITDMQDKVINVLVVWQSSRIERRGAVSVFDLVSRVHRAGGRIEFAAPGDQYLNESNDMSDALLAFAASKDHKESKDKSERVRAAQVEIRANKGVLGRLTYGYRAVGNRKDKHPVIYEPEARVVREAVERYLDRGESLAVICDDFNARGILGPTGKPWIVSTLGRLLRNPTLAGRQMNNRDNGEETTTILEFEGIITYPQHEQLVERLDSRAHRQGISPANVFMLTGVLFDDAGHPMYGKLSRYNYCYACRKGCGISVRVEEADAEVTRLVLDLFGHQPHMVRKLVPGKNYLDQIARKRQDIRELDPEAEDYDSKLAKLRAELAELRSLPSEPDHVDWVLSGKSIAEHWQSLSIAARRDWLKENGWKVTASKHESGGVLLTIDPTARGWGETAGTLGWPIEEWKRQAQLRPV